MNGSVGRLDAGQRAAGVARRDAGRAVPGPFAGAAAGPLRRARRRRHARPDRDRLPGRADASSTALRGWWRSTRCGSRTTGWRSRPATRTPCTTSRTTRRCSSRRASRCSSTASTCTCTTWDRAAGSASSAATDRGTACSTSREWDYHWSSWYQLAQPVQLNPGDLLYVECHWDNTAANQAPVNGMLPPPRDLHWATAGEMCAALAARSRTRGHEAGRGGAGVVVASLAGGAAARR